MELSAWSYAFDVRISGHIYICLVSSLYGCLYWFSFSSSLELFSNCQLNQLVLSNLTLIHFSHP
jgi:hypothetical protein